MANNAFVLFLFNGYLRRGIVGTVNFWIWKEEGTLEVRIIIVV